ncbi:MAG: hypothetical protein LBM75_06740 [Myxococcales bacterium]|jgi:hypothetical protein|nr:hypothetical protein [Myxococcales bacterium]
MDKKYGGKKDEQNEKGEMSVREAGKRGGEARKEELGHEGYVELGHMGGQRVRELVEEGREAEAEEEKRHANDKNRSPKK